MRFNVAFASDSLRYSSREEIRPRETSPSVCVKDSAIWEETPSAPLFVIFGASAFFFSLVYSEISVGLEPSA